MLILLVQPLYVFPQKPKSSPLSFPAYDRSLLFKLYFLSRRLHVLRTEQKRWKAADVKAREDERRRAEREERALKMARLKAGGESWEASQERSVFLVACQSILPYSLDLDNFA